MQRPIQFGAKCSCMGSEAGSPLRAHAFSNCEREGVMVTPFASLYNILNGLHVF